MRMKWKSFNEKEKSPQGRQKSTIGPNNIDLLSYTIPEIENSIKRLSGTRQNHHEFDAYRTVDTRANNRKKYIPRLF